MKISSVDLYHVRIPLKKSRSGFFSEHPYMEPSWIPGYRQTEMRFYLLNLKTDTGHEGNAAMFAMGPEKFGMGKLLAAYLLGMNPLDIRLVNQRIQEFSFIGMRNGWIDAAFWDLIGKIKEQPIWKLLGGHGGYIYPYASTGSTHNHDPKISRELTIKHKNDGYKGIKLRVKGTEIKPMVDYVAAARDAAGKDMRIMVDSNQGWPVDIVDETPKWSYEFALEYAKAIEKYDIYWLEEPLNRGNFEGLAELRKNTTTPIAGGEMNSSWRDFLAMLDKGSLDIYQPDAVLAGGTYAGGISVIYWLIREIQKRNKEASSSSEKVKYSPHTWTTGLGFAVAMQLVGVIPEEERSLLEYPLEGLWNPYCWGRYLKNLPVPDADMRIKIPDAPGLGVDVDWKIIRKFGKRIFHGTQSSVSRFILFDRGLKNALHLKEKKLKALEKSAKAEFEVPKPPF